ncbi:NFACT RNA binding domain-containing protein [Nanoarchaeota archaeon]
MSESVKNNSEVDVYLDKTVEQNAEVYFERAKKAKKKLKGARETLEKYQKELEKLEKEKEKVLEKISAKKVEKKVHKKEWYEKFHWFMSSEGFLCIGGRDATSNEIVIKKHTEENDLVLHTDMAGSPFFVIKNGQEAGEETIKEAAQATASYSRAWKLGLSILDVFYVKPEQVSKTAKSGEFMPKGAFMVYGKTLYLRPRLEMAIGVKDGVVIGGPTAAIKKQADKFKVVVPGKKKKSETAKKIKHKLGGDLDEITKFLPSGGCEIK